MENGSYSGTIKSIKSKTLDLETKITMTLKGLSLSTNNLAYTSKKELQENIFKGDDRFEFSAKTKGLYKTSSSYGGSFGTDGTIILGDGNDKLTVKGPIHLSNLLATGNGQDEIILRPTKEGQPTGLRLIDLDINDEINVSKMKIWNNSASCSYSPTRWNIIADTENYEQILLSTDGVTCKEANIVT